MHRTSIFSHDRLFWFGDLNFRIANLSASAIMEGCRSLQLRTLLANDVSGSRGGVRGQTMGFALNCEWFRMFWSGFWWKLECFSDENDGFRRNAYVFHWFRRVFQLIPTIFDCSCRIWLMIMCVVSGNWLCVLHLPTDCVLHLANDCVCPIGEWLCVACAYQLCASAYWLCVASAYWSAYWLCVSHLSKAPCRSCCWRKSADGSLPGGASTRSTFCRRTSTTLAPTRTTQGSSYLWFGGAKTTRFSIALLLINDACFDCVYFNWKKKKKKFKGSFASVVRSNFGQGQRYVLLNPRFVKPPFYYSPVLLNPHFIKPHFITHQFCIGH